MDSTLRNFSTTANLKTQRLTGNWATLEEILFAEPGQSFSESETISAKSTASKVTRNNQDLEYEGGWVDKKDDLAFSLPSNQTRRAFQENYYSSLEYNDNQKSHSQFYTHSDSNRDKKVQYYAERQVSQFETEDSFAAMLADNMIEETENRLREQRNHPAKQVCNFSLQTEDAFDLELEFLSPKSKRAKNISEEQQSVMLSTGISGCESTPSRVVRHDQKFDNSLSDATFHPSDLEFEPLSLTDRIPLRITFGAESNPRTLEQELADFNPVIDPSGIDNETLEYLCQRDRDYTPDPYYLKNKQPNLAWNMRAILVDWMIEVSVEFTLKRETFYAAVNYVDRFLSLYPNVQRQELQLIGVVSLFTSAKNEEIFSFQAEDFAKACDGAYTTAEIAKAESVLLTTLRWMLVPPTLNVFSQWYLSQWDLYIEKSPYALNCRLAALLQGNLMIQFRQPNESAYMLYREFMQYIDCVILDIDHLQYDKRTIIASVLYLLLGKEYQQFTMKQITEEFTSSSVSLFNKANAYNDLFADFLAYIFGFQMEEILPSVQYVARFFLLPLSFDLPRAVQIKGDNALDGHFEDFLSYQTHNTQALDFLKKKAKGTP